MTHSDPKVNCTVRATFPKFLPFCLILQLFSRTRREYRGNFDSFRILGLLISIAMHLERDQWNSDLVCFSSGLCTQKPSDGKTW